MSTAKTTKALKQRVERFFVSNNAGRNEVNDILSSLTNVADIYIFGGMIRDICLYGVKKFDSDIDVICTCDRNSLVNALLFNNINVFSENKFGGIRIKQLEWDIDIWCVRDTWAFKKGYIPFVNINSILSTTLMTWDSILYDFNRKQVICDDDYLKDLMLGRLELVLDKTPNEIGSIVRILRAIYGKDAISIGEKVINMLKNRIGKYSIDELVQYEINSYSKRYLNSARVESLISLLKNYIGYGDLSVEKYKQLSLDI
ncbi:hypothetical protein [Shewanella frigidimarina]|uniref:hypothetical protein n=1 Tax=Shewanella frigidimarina TaxID=56812 RepID=UPI003D7BACF7